MSLDSASSQQTGPVHSPTATVQVLGTRWAVAAGHALASEAAAQVLAAGGNAIDAGVAAGLCLGVVHCDMVSVAGVAPILVHLARTGETFQVSGVGPYPGASTLEYFRGLGNQIPPGLPRTVVPAAPAAWCAALERWGTMSFADVARAATEHAGRGFPVSSFSAFQMTANADKYRRWPTSTALYLNNGRPFRMGERLVQAELAETLSRMARAEAREGGSRAAAVRGARCRRWASAAALPPSRAAPASRSTPPTSPSSTRRATASRPRRAIPTWTRRRWRAWAVWCRRAARRAGSIPRTRASWRR